MHHYNGVAYNEGGSIWVRRSMINALIRGQFWKSYPKVVEVRCTKKKLFCRGRSSPSIIVIEREQCERVYVGFWGRGMRMRLHVLS